MEMSRIAFAKKLLSVNQSCNGPIEFYAHSVECKAKSSAVTIREVQAVNSKSGDTCIENNFNFNIS